MKVVYYIRHAKSSWKHEGLTDKERPLNKRGAFDAPLMAKVLKDKIATSVDGVLCSSSVRTQETLIPFQSAFEFDSNTILLEDSLYHASSEELVSALYGLEPTWKSVLLFAHNPGLTYLIHACGMHVDNVPTCGIFKVEFQAEHWHEVDSNRAEVKMFIYPKMYKS